MNRTASQARHRIYFVPGMFGFGRLAGYDYFNHLKRLLAPHFHDAGLEVSFFDVPTPPTSSIRERAKILGSTVAHTCGSEGPIHIVGHSTGGLDARLLLTPHSHVGLAKELQHWLPRVDGLVTLNTPHFGTPLASYFATVSGTRMLYALSLLTVLSLKLGEPSLAIFSRLLAGLGGIDAVIGGDWKLFSRATSGILRFVDKEGRGEISSYLAKVQIDQGAIIQITPEAMDLFNAAVGDREGVRYGSVVAAAPSPASLRAARKIRSPYMAFTAALYTTLYQFSGQPHERYGYASPSSRTRLLLSDALGYEPTSEDNDGIVPTLSMTWGRLLWATEADHLDTLGHFHDDQKPMLHTDWLTSGAHMTRHEFQRLSSAVARFLLSR